MSAFFPTGMSLTTETLPGGTRVFTSSAHRFGTDALLLLDFCEVKPRFSACDLGAGCGVLLLGLMDKGLGGEALALELDAGGAELITMAARENGLEDRLRCVQGDLRGHRQSRLFDIAISNPPYFKEGPPPPDARRAAARHEAQLPLDDLCAAAARLVKDRGRFYLCYPPARLAGLFAVLQAHRFAPKRLQLVRKTAQDAPWLALVDARKNGGEGLTILPDRLLPAGRPVTY